MVEGTGQQDYVVLARKYRSRTFDELIGQDALVRTLRNAIASDRIHHAYVLTGIRGIGKTSTARLLAMALNCENGPAVTWAEDDPQVKSIRTGTHPDVLEYDAASNRGVEDIAELFSGVNYAPVIGRYKVYIIDEVHMLSTHAFNALLKTLEEPPAKVKFIFATTEVQKIPVTVLSRCQRFDLRRIPSEVLQRHFGEILAKEKIEAEPDAIAQIAKAADGSVRDGLSLLDQAIALSHGEPVRSALVQDMLGLADRVRVYELLEHVLHGEQTPALAVLDGLYSGGQDATLVVQGMLEVLHLITRLKIVPGLRDASVLSELERTRAVPLAEKIGLPNLSRAYQLLVTVAQEVKLAERPYEALMMAMVRVAYLASLPELSKLMEGGQAVLEEAAKPESVGQNAGAAVVVPAMETSGTAAPWEMPVVASVEVPRVLERAVPGDWSAVVALVRQERVGLAAALGQQVRCRAVDATAHELVLTVDKGLHEAADLLRQLKEVLRAATGVNWQVIQEVAGDEAPMTLREISAREGELRKQVVAEDPLVKEVMGMFPGAVVEEVMVAS